MSHRTYSNAINLCLFSTGLAAVFFNSFPTPLVPGVIVLTAGVTALAVHVYALLHPIEIESDTASEDLANMSRACDFARGPSVTQAVTQEKSSSVGTSA